MKRLFVWFALIGSCFGQTFAGRAGSDIFIPSPARFCIGDELSNACMIYNGSSTAKMNGFLDFQLAPKIVSNLPPASLNAGRIYRVTDGQSASDCTIGNGSTSAVCVSDGSVWAALVGGAGGAGNPGGSPFSIQTNVAGTSFGGTSLGQGQQISGTTGAPIAQNKPIYDARDWMTCDGSTDTSSGMNTLLSTIGTTEATIRFLGNTTSSTSCRIGNTFFGSNVTLDFSGGGAITLISSTTPPGGAVFVNGTGVECGAGATCALPALSVTTGNTVVVLEAPYPGFTFKTTRVTDDCGDFFIHVFQSTAGQSRNQGAWIASSAHGGTCTITATANGSLTNHTMIAQQYSGMGPVVSLDTSASSNSVVNPMTSGAATVTAGSLVIGFGGQPFTAETCTAGAGFTQPAGLAGQTTNGFMCAEYQLSAVGGSLTATQNITSLPANQVYSLIALKPGNATATIWGGIVNPDQHQIFFNADSATGHGVIDFTGSTITQDVYPEWWGASPSATAATNTPALQAAVYAAIGGGLTQRRTNSSGLSIYNRPLRIGGLYQINDELKMFSALGFKVVGVNRLSSGIQQTAVNKRILNCQSCAYGTFSDLTFTTQSAQDTAHPLVDLDWNGTDTPGDLRPQFVDFDRVNLIGSSQAAIGLAISRSGGGAQGSNIYCRDCESNSFTEAAMQVGTHALLATNALDIGYSGDIQGCPKFGIAVYGGGYVSFGGAVEEASMENGFSTQTGFDMYCETTQGPCSMDYVRSESRRLISGNDIVLKKTRMINQAPSPVPGTTQPVGTLMTGTGVGGDGAFYTVTNNSSAFGGIGTTVAPLHASSGTGTTLVDTNQNIAGAVTIGVFTGTPIGETVTQAVTGSTGVVIIRPASNGTITGTASGQFTFGETVTQATTGVTCVVTTPTPPGGGPNLIVNNCSAIADNSHVWTGGTSGQTFTPTSAPVFAASTMLITASTGAPDNSHDWVGGTSAAHFTPTAVPTNEANFTVNAFTGMFVSTLAGKNAGCYGVITSNTATDITFAAGWTTRYMKLGCPFPDTTSTFVVEPGWNHGTVTSGGMTLVYLDENAIDCQTTFGSKGGCNPTGRLEDVIIAGGKIQANSTDLSMKNVQLYRQDWYAGNDIQSAAEVMADWDVKVIPTVAPTVIPYQGQYRQGWNLPSITGVSYTGANQWRLGTKAIVWDIGTVGTSNPPSNTSANSVWIGGRSDPGAGTTATRNILEFGGMLGRGAPLPSVANAFNTTNQNGTDTDITGGPSTGTGTGGAINFYTSTPGSSGTTVNSGTKRVRINSSGQIESLLSTGTPPFVVASTDNVANLNASSLNGATFAAPGPIGGGTPDAITATSITTTGAGSSFLTFNGPFGSSATSTAPGGCETASAPTTVSGAASTDTGLNCLPANAIIDAVVYRITTTITTTTSFTVGDATIAGRFCGTQSTLTAGTTGICFVQADQTGTSGPRQTTAAPVRVTFTGGSPGAGAIRFIVFSHTWSAPTS